MCSYLNEIEEVVSENVNADKMFTAWDVTVEVRKRSKDRVQHYEVKREVHKLFDNGCMSGYNRVLANLPGINPQPFLYFPPSCDPTTYTGKPAAPAAAVALPAPTSSMTALDDGTDVGGDGSVVYKFDTTDRLCVPNRLVRQLGLKAGDEVEVVCTVPPGNEVVVVQKGSPSIVGKGLSPVATYVVDSYDNVRITRGALNKIGLSAVAFEIDGDGNEIKVKKYA